MFGYIKPYKPDLRIRDFEIYKSVYCRLCKSLNKNFGIISTLTLSYDCTFLALIYIAVQKDFPCMARGRCRVNPFKKCNFCKGYDDIFDLISALSVIMTYYKICDDIQDSKLGFKLRAYMSIPFFYFSYKKASKKYPEVEKIISQTMQLQKEVENKDSPGIDESAEPTARMLSSVFALLSEDKNQKRILDRLGYFIGRWVYFIDAADDMQKDLKNKNFNAFLINLNGSKKEIIDDEVYVDCNKILNQTDYQIITTYNLLEINNLKDLLDNILNLGFAEMQKNILFERKEK